MHPAPAAPPIISPEPRWPVVLAFLGVGALYLALPASLSVGPRWLLLCIVAILLIPAVITHRKGHTRANILLGHLLSAIITGFMLFSVGQMIAALLAHALPPATLLRSGALLWLTNILVFASWYWRLDAGGPHHRATRHGHPTGAFLFPQMSLPGDLTRDREGRPWSPRFVDYLFLAFNTSTAFSPTDTPVLTRWAKALTMLQSLLSLTIIAILVGRAVNIM
jgi:hypothetical protein